MKKDEIQFTKETNEYILSVSLRENENLKLLRFETEKDPNSIMQIPPEQGQFMSFLIKTINANKILEIGTYTGYSTLCFALSIPDNGKVITCDINKEWAEIGEKYWRKAKVDNKIDLKIAPAIETLTELIKNGASNSFDFIFIDADKINYEKYYEKSIQLVRKGGIIAIDNVLLFGSVINPSSLSQELKERISNEDILTMQNLNMKIKEDKRVDISMLPIADGLTLVRKK